MTRRRCHATTEAGTPCQRWAGDCPDHDPAPVPAAIEQRDLRALGWWVVDRTITDAAFARKAAVIASVMRVLAALPPDPMDEEEALKEVELRGVIMSGCPPRTPEEWERAARVFDDEALAEFRRWQVRQDRSLPERDRDYRVDPEVLLD